VSARILVKRLPLLPHLRELAQAGCVPGGSKRNRDFYAPDVESHGVTDDEVLIAHDAQTSGGLLLSVPKERLEALLAALTTRRTLAAAVIGEVVAGPAGRVVLQG
jgi:selenide,water dikinase